MPLPASVSLSVKQAHRILSNLRHLSFQDASSFPCAAKKENCTDYTITCFNDKMCPSFRAIKMWKDVHLRTDEIQLKILLSHRAVVGI